MTKKAQSLDLTTLTPEQVEHMVRCTQLCTDHGGYDRTVAKLSQWTRNREAHKRSNAKANAKKKAFDLLSIEEQHELLGRLEG